MHTHSEPGVLVTLSDAGLALAYKKHLLRTKQARLHEIYAGCTCVGLVVVTVAWFVDALARSLA
jgi:hypothetical protein